MLYTFGHKLMDGYTELNAIESYGIYFVKLCTNVLRMSKLRKNSRNFL